MLVPGANVDAVGVRFPAITRKIGNLHLLDEAPVVVITKQGLNPIGRKLSDFDGAGFGQLQAGGSPKAAVAVMYAVEERGSEPEKSFPIGNIIFGIDISSSMGEPSGLPDGSSKLAHIQETVKTLANSGIPLNTPLTLVIFDSASKTVIRHTVSIEDFFTAIAGLWVGNNTNIISAFQEAVLNVKAFEKDSQNPDRNFFMLVTDGDHNTPSSDTTELFSKAEELAQLNCGGYIVGVGNHYNKQNIQELASKMGYAGWCHTPGDKSGVNVFGRNIPAFLDQMSRMEHYITVLAEGFSGNDNNKKFFSLTPAIIRANYQRTGSDLLKSPHYVINAGYQRDSFGIGFAPDKDLDSGKAKLYLCLQSHSGSELTFERKEIPIFTPDELPHYGMFEEASEAKRLRDLLLRAPLDFENFLCQDWGDPDAFDEFMKRNPDFMAPEQSVVISENLRKPFRDAASESLSRSFSSDASTRFTSDTICDFNPRGAGTVSDANIQKPPGAYDGHSGPLHPNLDVDSDANQTPPSGSDLSQAQSGGGFNPMHSGAFLGPLSANPIDVDSNNNVPPFNAPNPTGYNEADPLFGNASIDGSVDVPSPKHPHGVGYSSDGKFGMSILAGKPRINSDVLNKNEIKIGRSPEMDITIKSGGTSRLHCIITKESDGYYIEDLRSRNGTFVNGDRITVKTKLKDKDKVKIVDTVFVVYIIL